jgi:hypothetical protein
MLTQTHSTDFKIRAFKGVSIIARHYETLRASYDGSWRGTKVYENDVYDETSRKTTAGSKFIHFFNVNIKFGPSFKRKHSQVRVKYW